tara:strand:- start:1060 stop:2313 length:1254 start_codon:yes stop_codon:yes gene_type:complete
MQNTTVYSTIRYSLIVFPLAFAGIPIYLHAPDYYATNIGLKIEIIGFALLFLRLIDAFLDPLIGYLSDRYYSYRDKIIYFGSILLVLGFWMIFHPLNSHYLQWFFLSIFLCTLGFSIIAINIQAYGGLWNIPTLQVTKVIATREAIGLLGLLTASITPTLLFLYFKSDNFHILSIILLFIMFLSVYAFYKWFNNSEIKLPIKQTENKIFKTIFANSNVKLFFTSYFFSTFAASIPASLIIFYVRDYLVAENLLGLFLLVYFSSGALSMPLWKYLANKLSCKHAWLLSMVFALFSFFWAYFLQPNDILGFYAICLFSGMAVGANLALPSVIIAEYIHSNNHENYAASYYSISNFLSKFSLAVAAGTALPILGFMGYQPGVLRTDFLFPVVYAVIPCIIQSISIVILCRLIYSKNLRKT